MSERREISKGRKFISIFIYSNQHNEQIKRKLLVSFVRQELYFLKKDSENFRNCKILMKQYFRLNNEQRREEKCILKIKKEYKLNFEKSQ